MLNEALKWRAVILDKLLEGEALDLSDCELERLLGYCVGGSYLVDMAKILRDNGLLEEVFEQGDFYFWNERELAAREYLEG